MQTNLWIIGIALEGIELLLSIICALILIKHVPLFMLEETYVALIVFGTIGGYIIIGLTHLVGHALESRIGKEFKGMITITGCTLFIISGIIVLIKWNKINENPLTTAAVEFFPVKITNINYKNVVNKMLISAIIMIINSAFFLFDAIITIVL